MGQKYGNGTSGILISIILILFSSCTKQQTESSSFALIHEFEPSSAIGTVSFENDIKPVIGAKCASCHTSNYNTIPEPPSNCTYSWLNLELGLKGNEGCGLKDVYDRIMDQYVWQCPGELNKPYVVPGSPEDSYIFNKIAAHYDPKMRARICFGPKGNQASPMPASPLSVEDVQLFYDWIYDGAKRN